MDTYVDTFTAAAIEAAIRGAHLLLTTPDNRYAFIAAIRAELGNTYHRDDVDAVLIQMARQDDVWIVPESNQKVLRQSERDGAVSIGNQLRHLIEITH